MKYVTTALLALGVASQLSAGVINIPNSNFNAQTFAPGFGSGVPNGPITDWTEVQTLDPDMSFQVYNPNSVEYNVPVPGGGNVAQLGSGNADLSISQVLSATLLANDTYTLSGYAGFALTSTNSCHNGNAEVEAGGNILTPIVVGGNAKIGCSWSGTFAPFSETFTTGANPAGLGDPLEIVLTNKATGSIYEESSMEFADISLTDTASSASSVPEPSTLFLLVGGCLPLAALLRRRLS